MGYKDRIISLPRGKSFFLMGLRGSGKTSLLKRLFPEAPYIDLLDEGLYQKYLAKPGLFYSRVKAFKKESLIIVDEIQRMPELLNEVHRLIEGPSRHRFILTGSSARKLKKPGVNLLGGRAGRLNLHPFVPAELGADFDLNQALRHGLIPIVWSAADRTWQLKAYAHTYLTEEIKGEALVKDLPGFARFLEAAGLCHGQAVNMSAIARDCHISRDAAREFFAVLEDTMLGFFLPAYSSRLRLREKRQRKFYLADPGLARAMKGNFGPVAAEEKGSLFEGLVAQVLRAYESYRHFSSHPLYEGMSYWSPAEARTTEVDFLLKRGDELIAFEVKAKAQASSKDYKGLKAIKELANVKKRVLVCMGGELRKTSCGIDIWPFDFFCRALKEGEI